MKTTTLTTPMMRREDWILLSRRQIIIINNDAPPKIRIAYTVTVTFACIHVYVSAYVRMNKKHASVIYHTMRCQA